MTAQNSSKTVEGIAPRILIGGIPLIENAHLIKVVTIP
jgi:hypothetical protein